MKNFHLKGFSHIFFLIKKNVLRLDIYLIYPFVIFLSIIIILIRPIIYIRFAPLFTAKIGPFSSIPEMNLCEKDIPYNLLKLLIFMEFKNRDLYVIYNF